MTDKQLNDLDKAADLIDELDDIFGELTSSVRKGAGNLIWKLKKEQERCVRELTND